jgi:hypothetical protein
MFILIFEAASVMLMVNEFLDFVLPIILQRNTKFRKLYLFPSSGEKVERQLDNSNV